MDSRRSDRRLARRIVRFFRQQIHFKLVDLIVQIIDDLAHPFRQPVGDRDEKFRCAMRPDADIQVILKIAHRPQIAAADGDDPVGFGPDPDRHHIGRIGARIQVYTAQVQQHPTFIAKATGARFLGEQSLCRNIRQTRLIAQPAMHRRIIPVELHPETGRLQLTAQIGPGIDNPRAPRAVKRADADPFQRIRAIHISFAKFETVIFGFFVFELGHLSIPGLYRNAAYRFRWWFWSPNIVSITVSRLK